MTLKEFWSDPYKTRTTARVSAVRGPEVELDRTIFFAFSGGQESDRGRIGGHEVLKAEKRDFTLVYTLAEGHPFEVGQTVEVEIDWERRYRLMRLHFAAELVLELACRRLSGVEKVGAHIAQEKARIDFQWPESLAPLLPDLQRAAQAIIDSDQPILSAFSDEANERRFWKIKEFAEVPCGGTHPRSTAEIGRIRLKRVNPGKGKERIEIFVD